MSVLGITQALGPLESRASLLYGRRTLRHRVGSMAACMREYTLEFFTLLNAKGKKELIEWCMKEGLIASSYEYPKCNDRNDVTWWAIIRFLRNCTSHAEVIQIITNRLPHIDQNESSYTI
ncbi:uncharacterized protein TNCV_2928601 [Trichonephila clavipes]|nr:uncharacterized protein TNCV_2928601 [Trichonephila clavipes]